MRERFRRRLARLIQPDPVQEVEEELAFHLEERVRDYVERGMDPDAARSAALERLGDLEAARRESALLLGSERRAEAGRRELGVSWLDVKLGLRMLAKYPGLTLVGGLGMALAIAIGAGSFGVIYAMMDPALPLHEGERVVMLQNYDVELSNPNRGSHLHDLEVWRAQLASVEDLGAFDVDVRNLVAPDGTAEPVRVARMSASGFTLARVAPVLGRTLIAEDEREGAAPVVVIGEAMWRNRYAGDPGILHRTIRLGATEHAVVGVMPEGFRFPLNNGLWIPLGLDASDYERGAGPSVDVFGRLAPGTGLAEARAELTTIGRRLATEYPQTHAQLRPQVLPYTYAFFDIDTPAVAWAFHLFQAGISLLLVVVAINIAILIYARTATRAGEIAVRRALGASRRRVVGQLFVEAFLLSALAAAAGLAMAGVALGQMNAFMQRAFGAETPFWLDFGLSSGMVAYVAGLAILAGVIVGVVPALKATGRQVQSGLKHLGAGASGMQLGRTWTALIVAQVALAVTVLPVAILAAGQAIRYGDDGMGFAADEFLQGWVSMDRRESVPTAEARAYERAFSARFAESGAELLRQIEADPAVAGVTFSRNRPGAGRRVWVAIQGVPTPEGRTPAVRHGSFGHEAAFNAVATDYFQTFGVTALLGRLFGPGDAGGGANPMIVNRPFAERFLPGQNPLGRQVRYVGISGDASPRDVDLERAFVIVGVVPEFPTPAMEAESVPEVYHAVRPGEAWPMSIAVRVRSGPPSAFAPRLRGLALDTDGSLQLAGLASMDQARREARGMFRLMGLAVALVTLSVILLSSAGIYALMSFTVARRRKEIGIRSALGAHPRRLLAAVFSRAAWQIGIGVAVGLALSWLADLGSRGEILSGRAPLLLPLVAALMFAVGLLAALGPARRGLAVEPTEALRAE